MAQKEWKKLEKRALRLLSRHLQAPYSAGGPACKLAGYQIDAYGVFNKIAIVFECKTSGPERRINVNATIDKLAGRRAVLCRALKKQHGHRLKVFRFVVVVGKAAEI